MENKPKGFIHSEGSHVNYKGQVIHKVKIHFPFDEPHSGYGSGPDYFIEYAINENDGSYRLIKIDYESNGCGMGDQGGTNWKEGEPSERAIREFIKILGEVRRP